MKRALVVLALATAGCKPWADVDLGAVGAPVAWQHLAGGTERTCGLDAQGAAWCWGQGPLGTIRATQLCYPVEVNPDPFYEPPPLECTTRPLPVSGGHRFRAIATGSYNTLAVDAAGTVWAWGSNGYGLMGPAALDSTTDYPRPVTALAAWRFTAVAMDPFDRLACGVTDTGALICWGAPGLVTTGVPHVVACLPAPCAAPPVEVGAGTTWTAVAVGTEHVCALDAAGAAWCWGNGQSGQLGSTGLASCPLSVGAVPCSLTPRALATAARFTSLASRATFTCGLTTAGAILCWGTAGLTTYTTPVSVATGSDWIAVAVGGQVWAGTSVCAVRQAGTLWCFGPSRVGGLGWAPRQITGVPPLAGVAAGDDHACGFSAAGDAWCFGNDAMGALGDGDATAAFLTVPVPVSPPWRD